MYLALPSAVYPSAVASLARTGLPTGSKIMLEKPFGHDEESARALNAMLHGLVAEENIFRVDHFLYHHVVQDVLALRFANAVFEPLWSREYVDRVDIVWEETTGVPGRGDFYDQTGALKDMVQSHLLELLAVVAMERPAGLEHRVLRDARTDVLRRVQRVEAQEAAVRTARGRYTAGVAAGRRVADYTSEDGVIASRGTETYACVTLVVDTPRWRGVPFVLRTGKALGAARREIAVRFRPPREGPVPGVAAVVTLSMGPDRTSLDIGAAGSAGLPDIRRVTLSSSEVTRSLPASARLLLDVLEGNPAHSVRHDEVEECWRIVDSIADAWTTGRPPLQDYVAGSDGPHLGPGLLG